MQPGVSENGEMRGNVLCSFVVFWFVSSITGDKRRVSSISCANSFLLRPGQKRVSLLCVCWHQNRAFSGYTMSEESTHSSGMNGERSLYSFHFTFHLIRDNKINCKNGKSSEKRLNIALVLQKEDMFLLPDDVPVPPKFSFAVGSNTFRNHLASFSGSSGF